MAQYQQSYHADYTMTHTLVFREEPISITVDNHDDTHANLLYAQLIATYPTLAQKDTLFDMLSDLVRHDTSNHDRCAILEEIENTIEYNPYFQYE